MKHFYLNTALFLFISLVTSSCHYYNDSNYSMHYVVDDVLCLVDYDQIKDGAEISAGNACSVGLGLRVSSSTWNWAYHEDENGAIVHDYVYSGKTYDDFEHQYVDVFEFNVDGINIYSEYALDDSHPAGSLVNDLFLGLQYVSSDEETTVPLSALSYGPHFADEWNLDRPYQETIVEPRVYTYRLVAGQYLLDRYNASLSFIDTLRHFYVEIKQPDKESYVVYSQYKDLK